MARHTDAGWGDPKVLSTLAVVFLLGIMCGAAGMRQYLHWRVPMPSAHDFVYNGHRLNFPTLRAELNLSDSQEQTVKEVLDDFAKYYQNLEEQREDVAEVAKRRIFSVLDPDQKARFLKLLQDPPKR